MTPAQAARAREAAPSPAPGEYLAELDMLFARLHPEEEGAVIDTAAIASQVKAIVAAERLKRGRQVGMVPFVRDLVANG